MKLYPNTTLRDVTTQKTSTWNFNKCLTSRSSGLWHRALFSPPWIWGGEVVRNVRMLQQPRDLDWVFTAEKTSRLASTNAPYVKVRKSLAIKKYVTTLRWGRKVGLIGFWFFTWLLRHIQKFYRKIWGNRPLGRPRHRWETLSEWILEKQGGKVWNGIIWLKIGTNGRLLWTW